MPETDGLMLARQIKSDPNISQTRLLMLTSMCQRVEPAKLKEAHVEAGLVKPVKPKQLYQHLCRIMASKETDSVVSAIHDSGAHPAIVPLAMPTANSIKVLLAEDNPVNQKVAIRQLRKLGLNVDAVGDGREALTESKRIAYDLILMDCVMPELDGYETTRQIRRGHYGNPGVHIIAMTANAMQGDREKCLEAGMNDYVSKPVRIEDLRAALERYTNTIVPGEKA